MASGQKPRMSLPPELSAIDDGWGEDEQPTIARPSRMPTSPIREPVPDIPSAPVPLDLGNFDEDPDLQDRVTAIPEVPLDAYARQMMGSTPDGGAVTEAPPPSDTPFVLALDKRETETLNEVAIREMRRQMERHPSEMPTAPPPEDFDLVEEHITRQVPPKGFGSSLDTDPPPPISNAGENAVFSGRFSSAPPHDFNPGQVMKDRFAMGDFSGALEVAESILSKAPSDREARSLADKCREVLSDMYSSRINGLDRVPNIAMTPDQIRWLSLDHREGFMLSMIDGISSVDDLLDVSGMQRLDALRILCSLLDQKVIALR